MKKSRLAALAASLALGMTGMNSVHASLVLFLDNDPSSAGYDVIVGDELIAGQTTSGGHITTHTDGEPLKEGTVFYQGNVGTFFVTVTTGLSKPTQGPGIMRLNSVEVSGGAGDTLVVGLTDTDFTGSYPAYTASYSGATDGMVDFDFLHDTGNSEFGGTSIISVNSVSGEPFGGSDESSISPGTPYSLTITSTIIHGRGSQSTFINAGLTPVPLPPVALLFCSGLLGLFGIARLKKSISGNHALSA